MPFTHLFIQSPGLGALGMFPWVSVQVDIKDGGRTLQHLNLVSYRSSSFTTSIKSRRTGFTLPTHLPTAPSLGSEPGGTCSALFMMTGGRSWCGKMGESGENEPSLDWWNC